MNLFKLLTDLKAFRDALKARPFDARAAWAAFKVVGDDILGEPTSVGAEESTVSADEIREVCAQIEGELVETVSGTEDGVGKWGDGKLLELFKKLVPLILTFVV